MSAGVLVFGSINLDIAVEVARTPMPGETVLGGAVLVSPGGKGANQAHAARRFGAAVAMVGAVGVDVLAGPALAGLRAAGVDLSRVHAIAGTSTGIATIHVTADGENAIAVAPGANARAEAAWVDDATLAGAGLLLLQQEVPPAQSLALARRARALGCPVMWNLAPAVDFERIEPGVVDWLIVNETELAQVCASSAIDEGEAPARAAALSRAWRSNVVVTLGARGAQAALRDGTLISAAARAVRVVDTTGAGDTFAGVFAAALVEGVDTAPSLRLAVAAAGIACTRRGAQQSQPSRADIDQAAAGQDVR